VKKIPSIWKLLTKRDDLLTKVYFYFPTKSVGVDFDPYEKNYTYTNLNPNAVKMYVREIETESLIWKQMGTKEVGAKEILCPFRYKNWFLNANKIVIEDDDYEVYRENVGNRVMMSKRPFQQLRVILRKK